MRSTCLSCLILDSHILTVERGRRPGRVSALGRLRGYGCRSRSETAIQTNVSWFCTMVGLYLLLRHNHLLPRPFQFTVHELFYHWMLTGVKTTSLNNKIKWTVRTSSVLGRRRSHWYPWRHAGCLMKVGPRGEGREQTYLLCKASVENVLAASIFV